MLYNIEGWPSIGCELRDNNRQVSPYCTCIIERDLLLRWPLNWQVFLFLSVWCYLESLDKAHVAPNGMLSSSNQLPKCSVKHVMRGEGFRMPRVSCWVSMAPAPPDTVWWSTATQLWKNHRHVYFSTDCTPFSENGLICLVFVFSEVFGYSWNFWVVVATVVDMWYT